MPNAVIVGASIGGLVAATQLREAGWNVTLLEKGQTVGGLYATVETPFGICELGMHVLYVNAEQQALLTAMFGGEAFNEKRGVQVDIGASFNRGTFNPNSIYPDVRHLSELLQIREQVLQRRAHDTGANAADESRARFGSLAAEQVVAPILEKLWKQPAETLTSGALHAFFDLRRIILADKPQTDTLKRELRLDAVIGNPEQTQPAGEVYGGRRALFFNTDAHGLSDRAVSYLQGQGVTVEFGCDVRLDNNMLVRDGKPLSATFDACIVASPLAALVPEVAQQLDSIELSIFYFQIEPLALPAYYVLCHDSEFAASRIVNYRAYNFNQAPHLDRVLAVEALHKIGQPPSIECLTRELQQIMPGIDVLDSYELPRRLRVAVPSLANAGRLDDLARRVREHSGFDLLYFTGMRTDQGVFFSHHTVGAAHAAALDCSRRLP